MTIFDDKIHCNDFLFNLVLVLARCVFKRNKCRKHTLSTFVSKVVFLILTAGKRIFLNALSSERISHSSVDRLLLTTTRTRLPDFS
jgi:hypothetical protein